MTSLAQKITAHFGGDWHGDEGQFPTPGHSDEDRGMSIRDADDGDVLIHSFNGGDPLAIKDECRRLGLLPSRDPGGNEQRQTGCYEYRDPEGAVLYRTRRIEEPDRRKRFIAERPSGRGGWVAKLGDVPRVLYLLPELLAADSAQPVYLVEGERKADKLAGWGLVSTACAFGAKGWRDAYAASLTGRTVIILPDNDDEGRGFADRARASIEKAGGRPVIVALPGLDAKGDIMDWKGTADELAALTDAALRSQSSETAPELLSYVDAADLESWPLQAREWMLEGYEPRGAATLITGAGAVGKTLAAQQRLTCSAIGKNFLGLETRSGVSILITAEEPIDELHRRQEAINSALGITWKQLRGRLILVSLKGEQNLQFCNFEPSGRMNLTDRWKSTRATIQHVRAEHVALDNVAHFFAGDENNRNHVAAFTGLLDRLAIEIGGGVLFLGHPNKSGDEYSGSTGWENHVRSRLYMSIPAGHDSDARLLSRSKPNYAQRGDDVAFRWHNWAFVLPDELPPLVANELASCARAVEENDRFLQCLAKATEERRSTSPNPHASNFAPRVFAKMPMARHMSAKAFEEAMERLLHLGKIVGEQQLFKRDNRAWVTGLGLAPTIAPTPHQPSAPTAPTEN